MFWEALDEASEALRPPDRPEGVWQLVLSKKSMKLLKAVNNLTGIRCTTRSYKEREPPYLNRAEESSSKPTQKKKRKKSLHSQPR